MSDRTARLLVWAALVVGVVVRVAFLEAKPFWRDEAWVALLLEDPLAAVAEGRPVPLAFLWATWPATLLPFPPEVALRWLPLCAGIALLPLLARFAISLGASRWTAAAVVWLAAGLPALVYYSRELKPYGLDAVLAVVVPLLAWEGFGASRRSPRARGALMACLAVAPWMTFGALFPILAVLAWGWVVWWRRADTTVRRDWALVTAVFGVSALGVWAFAWRAQVAAPRLLRFWSPYLLAASERPLMESIRIAAERYLAVSASYLFPYPVTLAALALAIVGAATWPRPHRAFLLWLGFGTAAFCIAAGVTDRYLLVEGRLLLFAAPTLLLWSAQGLAQIGRWTRTAGVLIGVPIALGLWWSAQALTHRVEASSSDPMLFFRFDVLHDVDAMIGRATELVPAGEPVLASRYSAYAFQLYAAGRLPQAAYCDVYCFDDLDFLRDWLARVSPRGWIILTDEEIGPMGAYLAATGFARTTRSTARGVVLWEVVRAGPA